MVVVQVGADTNQLVYVIVINCVEVVQTACIKVPFKVYLFAEGRGEQVCAIVSTFFDGVFFEFQLS